MTETRKGLLTLRRGAAPWTLPGTRGLARPQFAGAAIAAIDENNTNSHPVLVDGDGSRRVLGGPTGYVTDLTADEAGVAWLANGCVRYAAIIGPVPVAPVDGPCPSTEIGLYTIDSSRLRSRSVRVRVPVHRPGRRQAAPDRASHREGLRVARREGWFRVDAKIPDGRIGPGGRGASELTVKGR